MDASRVRAPGELVFAVAMLLFGVTALWLAWRIAGFSSWSSPGVMPLIAAAAMSGSGLVILRNTLRMKRPEISPGSTLARQFFHQVTPLPIVLFTALIVVIHAGARAARLHPELVRVPRRVDARARQQADPVHDRRERGVAGGDLRHLPDGVRGRAP